MGKGCAGWDNHIAGKVIPDDMHSTRWDGHIWGKAVLDGTIISQARSYQMTCILPDGMVIYMGQGRAGWEDHIT